MKAAIKLEGKVQGLYKFKVLKAATREVVHETDLMENLITNFGMNNIGQGNIGSWGTCVVGTGTNAPAFTDTQLQTLVAVSATQVAGGGFTAGNNPPEYYAEVVIIFEFAEGAAAGNLSEVGVGTSSTSLQSRALIVDGAGDPTTITVLADEILQVTFVRRLYPPTADTLGSIILDGNSYDYTLRAANVESVGNWSASLQNSVLSSNSNDIRAYEVGIEAITSQPAGASDARTSVSTNAYVDGSYQRTGTITFGLTQGNFVGGIGSIKFETSIGSTFQVGFSPSIPKDDTQILTLDLIWSWARHTA